LASPFLNNTINIFDEFVKSRIHHVSGFKI